MSELVYVYIIKTLCIDLLVLELSLDNELYLPAC